MGASVQTSRFLPLVLLLATGCSFDEDLPEVTISGTIVIPKEAATRTVEVDGVEQELTDPRFLGPVYLGAFPSVSDAYFDYPHPEMGPVIDPSEPGDTYPYGGTSVGRFDFACFESVACRVTTGRFDSFEGMLEYFNDFTDDPVTDPYGTQVESAKYWEQYCLDYYYATSYDELRFLAVEQDENGEWVSDLDFEQDESTGDFVAEFDMHHTYYVEGMSIWGWVDNPSEYYSFSTCNTEAYGACNYEYNLNFYAGDVHHDVLNFPSDYISQGDWVVSSPHIVSSPEDQPELVLDFHYE